MSRFGTDGIRGRAGAPPLDREGVTLFGEALARRLCEENGRPARVFAAGDTRESTPRLAAWLHDGFAAAGGELVWGGVLPTPAVARLTTELGHDAGVAISASHNPAPDNGLKLVDRNGFKWSESREADLEATMDRLAASGTKAADLGAPPLDPEMADRYSRALRATAPEHSLEGLRIACDAANGAAAALAGPLFESLGAQVEAVGVAPDGTNINESCGSTAPQALARLCRDAGCHLGLAFDGDADRLVLCDSRGVIHDGDAILYLWARALAETDDLPRRTIVATAMSNLGLLRALERDAIEVRTCGVGDRQVVETLRRERLLLGGEQSGHVVHLGLSTTGDGLLTGLQMAWLLAREGRSLEELLQGFERFPQTLRNVPVDRKPPLESMAEVTSTIRRIQDRLGRDGRLLVRYSGTEPLARVMVEGPDEETIENCAAEICHAIESEIGART